MLSKLTYANVVATIALFIAVSTGGAWAANKLINGQSIKPHTITGKQVKNRSLPLKVLRGKLPAGPPFSARPTVAKVEEAHAGQGQERRDPVRVEPVERALLAEPSIIGRMTVPAE